MKGYMTLTEASLKFNVSTRLLSLYCNQGRIKGAERAGKIWLIPEDAELPEDGRIRNGKYIGWRNRFNQNTDENVERAKPRTISGEELVYTVPYDALWKKIRTEKVRCQRIAAEVAFLKKKYANGKVESSGTITGWLYSEIINDRPGKRIYLKITSQYADILRKACPPDEPLTSVLHITCLMDFVEFQLKTVQSAVSTT